MDHTEPDTHDAACQQEKRQETTGYEARVWLSNG